MDKSTAINFLEALAWFEAPFGKLDSLLNELEGEECNEYKKIIGTIALTHFDLIMPIINQYPELDPDAQGKEMYKNFKLKYEKNT